MFENQVEKPLPRNLVVSAENCHQYHGREASPLDLPYPPLRHQICRPRITLLRTSTAHTRHPASQAQSRHFRLPTSPIAAQNTSSFWRELLRTFRQICAQLRWFWLHWGNPCENFRAGKLLHRMACATPLQLQLVGSSLVEILDANRVETLL